MIMPERHDLLHAERPEDDDAPAPSLEVLEQPREDHPHVDRNGRQTKPAARRELGQTPDPEVDGRALAREPIPMVRPELETPARAWDRAASPARHSPSPHLGRPTLGGNRGRHAVLQEVDPRCSRRYLPRRSRWSSKTPPAKTVTRATPPVRTPFGHCRVTIPVRLQRVERHERQVLVNCTEGGAGYIVFSWHVLETPAQKDQWLALACCGITG